MPYKNLHVVTWADVAKKIAKLPKYVEGTEVGCPECKESSTVIWDDGQYECTECERRFGPLGAIPTHRRNSTYYKSY